MKKICHALILIALLSGCNKKEETIIQREEALDEYLQQQLDQSDSMLTFQVVKRGSTCRPCGSQCVLWDGPRGADDMKCDYRVGKDLEFSIRSVGQSPKVMVSKTKGEEGDFHLLFYPSLYCIVVVAGQKMVSKIKAKNPEYNAFHDRWAYVSPANGMAYHFPDECEFITMHHFGIGPKEKL